MRGAVVFAFDDGWTSVQLAYNALQPAGIRATVPTCPSLVGTSGANDFLDWTALDAMVAGGWELTNHSRTHADLTSLSAGDLTDEVDGAQADLLARGYGNNGHLHFVVPFHTTNSTVKAAAAANHVTNREITTTSTRVAIPITKSHRQALRSKLFSAPVLAATLTMIDDAISTGTIAFVHTHGGDTENWSQIRDHIVANGYEDDCHTMTSLFDKYEWLWNRPQPAVNAYPKVERLARGLPT